MSSPPSLYAADEMMPLTPSDDQLPSTSVASHSQLPSAPTLLARKSLSLRQETVLATSTLSVPLDSGDSLSRHNDAQQAPCRNPSDHKVPSSGSAQNSVLTDRANGAHIPRGAVSPRGRVPRMVPEPDPFVEPAHDANILYNDRVLANLLRRELLGRKELLDYFQVTQKNEIRPRMRVIVTEWMADVCLEERMEAEVFPLAISYLDRFLSVQAVFKHQLQGLAAACIFVASKVKQPVPVTATRIAHYTDYSATPGQLISWELLILSRLGWDVSTGTDLEFAEHIIARLELRGHYIKKIQELVQDIVYAMLKDFKFALWRPSVRAAVAVCLAADHCLPNQNVMHSFIVGVAPLLRADPEQLRMCAEAVQSCLCRKEDSENEAPRKSSSSEEEEREDEPSLPSPVPSDPEFIVAA